MSKTPECRGPCGSDGRSGRCAPCRRRRRGDVRHIGAVHVTGLEILIGVLADGPGNARSSVVSARHTGCRGLAGGRTHPAPTRLVVD